MSMSQVGSGLPRLLAERYELSEQVASGGMTSVWRGHDRVLGRDVVVKVLHPELAADPSFRARFHEEAVNAARLTHPNIVALYDTGEQADVAYIVMELVNGPNLRDAIGRHGPMPPSRAARLSLEVSAALDYAHQAGVCHGSLKPGNILLADDGTVKVADFSIARAATDDDPGRTGEVLGLDGHLAPEVVRGEEADGRADVYGLGACLYEMLTGRPPGADPATTIPPRALRAGVPRDLDTIVRQAMATDPDDRFQTVQAMAAALSRSATGADSGPPGDFLPMPPDPTWPEVTPSRGFLRHEGRLLGWVLALVAVAAVLVAVGLTLAKDDLSNLFGEDPPSRPPGSQATTAPAPRVRVAGATSFDPEADQRENQDLAPLAIDADRTTGWQTEGYRQNFGPGGIKQGVGLVLDLGRSQEVGRLTLALAPTGGSELAIFGSDDPPPSSLEGWTRLDGPRTGRDRATFNLKGSHRYLLIWFSSLPQDDEGKYRGGVANVTLTS
jgi:eukaryotic-like serine/threonine-protein kinase